MACALAVLELLDAGPLNKLDGIDVVTGVTVVKEVGMSLVTDESTLCTADDSEEMIEDNEDRIEVAAVVSKEMVLKGRPLDAGIPLGRTIVETVVAACALAMNESTRVVVSFIVKMEVQQLFVR